jgi:hypothetical protein
MTRGTPRRDHRGIAQGGAAFQVDGDDIFRLVVIQRSQDALQQIAWRRRFFCGRLGGRLGLGRFLGWWLFGFLCRDLLGGFGGGFLAGGLFGNFTSQG